MVYTTELASPRCAASSRAPRRRAPRSASSSARHRLARQSIARAEAAAWGWRIPFIASLLLSSLDGSCVAASTNRATAEGRGGAAAAAGIADRRLEADRADVRHRRDDERGLLPHVHLRGRAAQGGEGSESSAREHDQPVRGAVRQGVRRLALGSRRPPPADDRADDCDDGARSGAGDDAERLAAEFILGQIMLACRSGWRWASRARWSSRSSRCARA